MFLLALPIAGAPAHSETASAPRAIEQFYSTLIDVMKQGRQLGFAGRYDRLKAAIEETFNLPLMARLSVGPQWQSLTPEQQTRLTAAFGAFTVSTYASRFDDWSGERAEVLPDVSSTAGGTLVQTRFIKSDGEPVVLNYLMRENDGRWQIIDVFLSGTISELATRRSEFTSVLRRDGPDGLLQLLDRKIADLKTS